jgi:DNA-binding MarR family transcriptional regulator
MEAEAEEAIYEEVIAVFYSLKKDLLQMHPRLAAGGDLSQLHLGALGILSRGPLPASELADKLRVSRPQLTVLLDRLAAKGLAERGPTPDDRRSVRAAITPAGRDALESAMGQVRGAMRGKLARLDAADLAELKRSLLSLSAILAKI